MNKDSEERIDKENTTKSIEIINQTFFKTDYDTIYSGKGYDIADFLSYNFETKDFVVFDKVKYFVSNDTLFTDKIYRSMGVYYMDDDGKPALTKYCVRDFYNNPTVNGWYYIVLDIDELSDAGADLKLCDIILYAYDEPKAKLSKSRVNASLWNASKYTTPNVISDSIPGEAAKIVRLIEDRQKK